MKRKILLLIAIAIVISSFTFYTYADSGNTFYYGEDYVIFSSDCELSYTQKQKIADIIISGRELLDYSSVYLSSACSHTYKTEYPLSIRHKVYALSPRCVSECHEAKICTKCGDVLTRLLSATRIICCD